MTKLFFMLRSFILLLLLSISCTIFAQKADNVYLKVHLNPIQTVLYDTQKKNDKKHKATINSSLQITSTYGYAILLKKNIDIYEVQQLFSSLFLNFDLFFASSNGTQLKEILFQTGNYVGINKIQKVFRSESMHYMFTVITH